MKLFLALCLLVCPALSLSQELGPEELVKKVTAEDVRRVAKKYLVPERRSMVIGLPSLAM